MHAVRFPHLAFTVFTVAVAPVAQQSVVIPCDRDNTLYESSIGAFSNALGESVFVGVTAQGLLRRALLRFDVAAALPSGAHVVTADLHIDVVYSGSTAATPAAVHRVAANWGEGTSYAIAGGGGQGAPSTAGDATWIHRFYASSAWVTAGGDYTAARSCVFELPVAGAATTGPARGLAADVQGWLEQPATNHGWLVKADDETAPSARARRIHSRHSTGARPTLHVHYLVPGTSGVWGDGCAVGAGTFAFAFGGAVVGGSTVQLEHTGGPADAIAVNYFALELDAVGTPLLPGCALHLPLDQGWILGNVFVLDAAGAAASPWPVPNLYPGLFFVSQSAALAATPLGLVTSNAGVAVIQ